MKPTASLRVFILLIGFVSVPVFADTPQQDLQRLEQITRDPKRTMSDADLAKSLLTTAEAYLSSQSISFDHVKDGNDDALRIQPGDTGLLPKLAQKLQQEYGGELDYNPGVLVTTGFLAMGGTRFLPENHEVPALFLGTSLLYAKFDPDHHDAIPHEILHVKYAYLRLNGVANAYHGDVLADQGPIPIAMRIDDDDRKAVGGIYDHGYTDYLQFDEAPAYQLSLSIVLDDLLAAIRDEKPESIVSQQANTAWQRCMHYRIVSNRLRTAVRLGVTQATAHPESVMAQETAGVVNGYVLGIQGGESRFRLEFQMAGEPLGGDHLASVQIRLQQIDAASDFFDSQATEIEPLCQTLKSGPKGSELSELANRIHSMLRPGPGSI